MLKKLDIVATCTLSDLPVFKRTVQKIEAFLPVKSIHVFVPAAAVATFQAFFGSRVMVHDQDRVFPCMRYADLASHPHRVFPLMTGWFFQQFLKYSYAFENTDDDYYLIWDADTIPLCPMEFFDDQGRMLMVPAEEFNGPYFETYRQLLGENPHRDYSFIAQHLIVQKSVLREMLEKISRRAGRPVDEWVWAIADGLKGDGNNLFSEYETYGHYLKNHYPARLAVRPLLWLRDGTERYTLLPREKVLSRLGENYVYASFESKNTLRRRAGRAVKSFLSSFRG
jgi:hypothetical protein